MPKKCLESAGPKRGAEDSAENNAPGSAPMLGNGRNTVSRVLFRKRELTEFCGKLGEFCEKLSEFAVTHK